MRIQIETAAEARILEARWQAVTHALGPMVALEARLPDGRILRAAGGTTPAAQCASLNERMEEMLARWENQSRGRR